MSSVAPHRAVNIEDLRLAAKRRLPRAVFDYIDGGADAEVTLRGNCRAFEDLAFRPSSAVATRACDLRTRVAGVPLELPFLLAPVGSCRLFYPRGEEAAAREAGEAGTAYILSTLSGCRLEDVKAASRGPVFHQLYLLGGRDVALGTIERARRAGMSALVVTIDTPVAGMRERDLRNGMKQLTGASLWPKLPFLGQFMTKPRWAAGFLADGGLMQLPKRGDRRPADALRGRRHRTRAVDDLLAGSEVDPRSVAGSNPRQRRAHCRRCPPGGG